MRDPARIYRILKKFEQLWSEHPDIRLGQLITNIVCLTDWDIFYIEDDAFEVMLNRWLDADFNQVIEELKDDQTTAADQPSAAQTPGPKPGSETLS